MRPACLLLLFAVLIPACRRSSNNAVGLQQTSFQGSVLSIQDSVVASYDSERTAQRPDQQGNFNINWDGAAVTNLTNGATADFPADLFLNGAGLRQLVIGAGQQPLVSENGFATLPSGAPNPSASAGLESFTGTVNFAVLGSDSLNLTFFLDDQESVGLVHGFGVIFSDVELEEKSGLRFFNSAGEEIGNVRAEALGNGEDQFVGAIFNADAVAHVIVDLGDNDSFGFAAEDPSQGVDHVVVDDFRFFLSARSLPTADFVAAVDDIGDDVVQRYSARRDSVALDNVGNFNINWDGGAVTVLTQGATADFPPALFRDGAGLRQIIVGGVDGENPLVSEDGFATLADGSPNPSDTGGFESLTGTVNFATTGSDRLTVSFTLADTEATGLVHGFGAIFTDVEVAGSSGIRYFDQEGNEIHNVRALPLEDGEHQFVGALFAKAVVAHVEIDLGNNDSFGTAEENPEAGIDHVVLDDFRFLLSDREAPLATFGGQVQEIGDASVRRFESRRGPLALDSVGNFNINWDGAAVTNLTLGATADFPPELFRDGAGNRQLIIGGVAGDQPTVSESAFATLADGSANPSDNGGFAPFTGSVNFAAVGSNTATVSFTLAETAKAGQIHGFGVIFTDVEAADRSGLRFFDASGAEIGSVRAQPLGNGQHQFVAGIFPRAEVASVQIDFGDNASFGTALEDPLGGVDHVVVDDFRFFLSAAELPTSDFVGTVQAITDAAVLQFETRRAPLALRNTTNFNINWDGGAVTVLTQGATANFIPDLFLNGAGLRQLVIGGPGEQVLVSEDGFATLPGGGGNPSHPLDGSLDNLSAPVNFSVRGGNVVTVSYFLADQITAGTTHGFGAIFTDVEVADRTGLRFFDATDNLIHDVRCPAGGNGEHQFVGAIFSEAVVARVEIDLGDNGSFGIGAENPLTGGDDHVVLDDFRFFLAQP